jgi:ABC-type uncharacterized transport system auxiliary subunit
MKKIGLLFIIIIFGFGCVPSPPKHYHQIYLPENPEVAAIRIDKILYVDRVEVKQLYDNFEIVYRDTPYHLNYYNYDFWAQKPAQLIRDSFLDFFRKNRNFSGIYRDLTKGDPDLVLKARIRAIEEEDRADAWYARLSMEIEIGDFETEEILVFHEFEKLRGMPEKDVKHLAVAISQILEEELKLVLNALSKKLQ